MAKHKPPPAPPKHKERAGRKGRTKAEGLDQITKRAFAGSREGPTPRQSVNQGLRIRHG